jgi:hypothetical protein
MKTNIKYLMVIMAALSLAISVNAQTPTWAVHTKDRADGGDFIANIAKTLVLTNNVNFTNLTLNGSTGTNATGTVYTNKNGTRVTTTASVGTNANLLATVALWSLQDGGVPFQSTNLLSTVVNSKPVSYANISLTVSAGAGTAQALTLIFAPVWDGVNVDTSGNFDFTWGFTPTASSTKTVATNAPLHQWIGAKAVALKSISSADSTTTKTATILAVNLNGFGPP